jgi:armadillo repeat-containing protein 6
LFESEDKRTEAMPPAKPKLAQEDWDEAVRTNIDDFDMTPGEAVQAAAEEFAARYDLSGVVREADGAAAAAAHPAALAARALRAALLDAAANATAIDAAVADLATACFPEAEEDRQPALAVAGKEEVARLLLEAAAAASSSSSSSSSSPLRLPAMRLLRRLLLRSADARLAFLSAQGVERCTEWLSRLLLTGAQQQHQQPSSSSTPTSPVDWPRVAAVVACCEAACHKSEEAKCRFASYVPATGALSIPAAAASAAAPCPDEEQPGAVGAGGFVSLLLAGVLSSSAASSGGGATPAAVCAAAGVLRSLTYADDDAALASRAFTHARLLAKSHGALRDLLCALQRLSKEDEEEEEEEEEEAQRGGGGGAGGGVRDQAAAAGGNDDDDDDDDSLPSTRAEAIAAVLAAVRSVAANDDACRGFSDDGGVRACLGLLRRAVAAAAVAAAGGEQQQQQQGDKAASAAAALARSAAGALRQLANSDPVKTLLAADGALDVIVDALARFSGAGAGGCGGGGGGGAGVPPAGGDDVAPTADDEDDDDDDADGAASSLPRPTAEVVEPVAGLLAAMTLRQPDVAARAVDAGAVAALCSALGRLTAAAGEASCANEKKKKQNNNNNNNKSTAALAPTISSSSGACRQLCMAVRNMACRGGDDLRAAFLARGAEPLLRAAKAAHPSACGDVGSAALRDLGLDNYNA